MKKLYEDIKRILNEIDIENTAAEYFTNLISDNNKLSLDERVELMNIVINGKCKYIHDHPEEFTLEKMYEKLEEQGELDILDDYYGNNEW